MPTREMIPPMSWNCPVCAIKEKLLVHDFGFGGGHPTGRQTIPKVKTITAIILMISRTVSMRRKYFQLTPKVTHAR